MDFVLFVLFSLFSLQNQQVHGSLKAIPCKYPQCTFPRGHFHIITSQTSLNSMMYGHDIRTFIVTKDHRTRFDVTFHIKNIKNMDMRWTQIAIAAYMVGYNEIQYVKLTSLNERLFHFKAVTSVQISLVSYQNNARLDIYYYMDCGYIDRPNTELSYPEPHATEDRTIAQWDLTYAPNAEPKPPTCWFIISWDQYHRRHSLERTYVIIRNTTLMGQASINVADVTKNELLMTHPKDNERYDLSVATREKNTSIEVGIEGFSASIIIYVELLCPARWIDYCAATSRFQILFKSLNFDDDYCKRIEAKCRYHSGRVSYACKPVDKLPPSDYDKKNEMEQYKITKCPGMRTLLQTISQTVDMSNKGILTAKRMGMRAMCSNMKLYCSSIRICKSQGPCSKECLRLNVMGICRSFL